MNALIHPAAELQAVCVAHNWRFCFIGGLAVQRWGEPRELVDKLDRRRIELQG